MFVGRGFSRDIKSAESVRALAPAASGDQIQFRRGARPIRAACVRGDVQSRVLADRTSRFLAPYYRRDQGCIGTGSEWNLGANGKAVLAERVV